MTPSERQFEEDNRQAAAHERRLEQNRVCDPIQHSDPPTKDCPECNANPRGVLLEVTSIEGGMMLKRYRKCLTCEGRLWVRA